MEIATAKKESRLWDGEIGKGEMCKSCFSEENLLPLE